MGKNIKWDKILTMKENANNTDYIKNFCLSEHTIKQKGKPLSRKKSETLKTNKELMFRICKEASEISLINANNPMAFKGQRT